MAIGAKNLEARWYNIVFRSSLESRLTFRPVLVARLSRVNGTGHGSANRRDRAFCLRGCSFDFSTTYGTHGTGFIEVHHV
jgi:hypothetical protein